MSSSQIILVFHSNPPPHPPAVISTDTSGLITYWNAEGDGSDPSTLGGTVTSSTTSSVTFSDPILETDLYSMLKKKKSILTTAIGSTGKFAVYGEDRRIRLFDFKTGKCLAKYDDTEKGFEKEMEAGKFEFDR